MDARLQGRPSVSFKDQRHKHTCEATLDTQLTPPETFAVGNLPFGVTEELLMDICSEAGPVKFFRCLSTPYQLTPEGTGSLTRAVTYPNCFWCCRLVSDAKTGDPKGFAFCEYFDVASVQNAIRLLNNREVMGRKIRIDYGTDQATTGMEGKPGDPQLRKLIALHRIMSPSSSVAMWLLRPHKLCMQG